MNLTPKKTYSYTRTSSPAINIFPPSLRETGKEVGNTISWTCALYKIFVNASCMFDYVHREILILGHAHSFDDVIIDGNVDEQKFTAYFVKWVFFTFFAFQEWTRDLLSLWCFS